VSTCAAGGVCAPATAECPGHLRCTTDHTGDCLASCGSDGDCASGYTCQIGGCVAAAAPDAGPTGPDASTLDASPAASPDASPAASPDASPAASPDASPAAGPDAAQNPPEQRGGCGCHAGGSSTPAPAIVVVVAALLLSVRRRAARRR
jgi:MYXO-CTERM domain-containing protein